MKMKSSLSPPSFVMISVICFILATCCPNQANAFSLNSLNDESAFRYQTRNKIKQSIYSSGSASASASASAPASKSTSTSTLTITHLYKDTRQADGLPPVYSSVVSNNQIGRWASVARPSPQAVDATSATSTSSPIQQMFNGFTSMFGVMSDVINDSLADVTHDSLAFGPPPSLMEENEPIKDAFLSSHAGQSQVISLVDISWLKAHEEIVSEERVLHLHASTIEWDAYKLPLLVDSRSGAILDGHHRYAVGVQMGLSKLPVILVDYLNDDSISVDVWPECGIDCLTKEKVIEMSLSNTVFPPKTSKHDFVSSFAPINVPLSKLL